MVPKTFLPTAHYAGHEESQHGELNSQFWSVTKNGFFELLESWACRLIKKMEDDNFVNTILIPHYVHASEEYGYFKQNYS